MYMLDSSISATCSVLNLRQPHNLPSPTIGFLSNHLNLGKMWSGLSMAYSISSVIMIMMQTSVDGSGHQQVVPCYFIFGDSLVDNGNNNDLATFARANYAPYGIDFPDGPTGRFTNGRNSVDFIAEFLGFERDIPPFTTARGRVILEGVNYGSGSAGILDQTGNHLGVRISFNQQLRNHRITVKRIGGMLGSRSLAKKHLGECIYTVGIGSNDYINNYFLPMFYPTANTYDTHQYAQLLTQQLSRQLEALYKMGARKIGVFSVGSAGCIPAMTALYGHNGTWCVEKINKAIQVFNDKLKLRVDDLNSNLGPSSYFIYVDTNDTTRFEVEVIPCCKVSLEIGDGLCNRLEEPCSNRKAYRFWDAFHPTEASNLVTAQIAYRALSPFYNDCFPIHAW